ncbi:MAG TPA: DUF4149 domain-containing protein [Candidatus Binataceae bacterium]|nr:DUF4149 domain-containing protein [Candidatus Binataceae bacterium]
MIALFIYLMALGCWLGGMVFFAFFTAPVIFTRLSITDAGKVVAGIFPLYYGLAYGAGAVSILLSLYLALTRAARGWWLASCLLLAVALGLIAYAGVVVGPKVDAVKSVTEEAHPDPVRKAQFDRLHHLSVQLNASAMVLETIAVLTTAAALV